MIGADKPQNYRHWEMIVLGTESENSVLQTLHSRFCQ